MLKIFGGGASQPTRAVCWACLIKGLPFEFVEVGLDKVGPGGPLSKLNITGQIPILQDDRFVLYEMPAMLTYLAEKHDWSDLLPANLETRARVHQYLHFHHNHTRRVSEQLMAPHVSVVFIDVLHKLGYQELVELAEDPDKLTKGHACLTRICGFIEEGYLADGTSYLCGNQATLADIACYQELGQIKYARLFDFSAFARISRWLDKMAQLPHHDEAHAYNIYLGDINVATPNTTERFFGAIEASNAALEKLGVSVRSF